MRFRLKQVEVLKKQYRVVEGILVTFYIVRTRTNLFWGLLQFASKEIVVDYNKKLVTEENRYKFHMGLNAARYTFIMNNCKTMIDHKDDNWSIK